MNFRSVHVLNVGKSPYLQSLKLQNYLLNRIIKDDWIYKNVLILTEHDPVYTIGIRSKNYTIDDEMKLKSLGADFIKTNRGGLITFHGPGQLVAYPIINLKNFKKGVRWYVCHLEKSIVNLCQNYGIDASTTFNTGVWIGDRKICAIGIHVSQHVTMHGLALNCNNDLSWFDHIVPCGIEDKKITSLSKECNKNITVQDVKSDFISCFESNIDCKTIPVNRVEVEEIKRASFKI